ncbi:uncharacterized protein J3D65DRAFT_359121 [Phyllosticta citribraziliensis]|uniref:Uncharacterized protein n=1 Tax=Phyllosticta citribraziliensis TaxID=989973 RepID=A0ABR1LP34_9PEZI
MSSNRFLPSTPSPFISRVSNARADLCKRSDYSVGPVVRQMSILTSKGIWTSTSCAHVLPVCYNITPSVVPPMLFSSSRSVTRLGCKRTASLQLARIIPNPRDLQRSESNSTVLRTTVAGMPPRRIPHSNSTLSELQKRIVCSDCCKSKIGVSLCLKSSGYCRRPSNIRVWWNSQRHQELWQGRWKNWLDRLLTGPLASLLGLSTIHPCVGFQ